MAIQLGSAYGKVTLNVKGFTDGINTAKRGLETFQRSIGGVLSTLTALVSAAVLIKIGKGIFDIGENAVLTAARVQELEIINQQLGKNAGISIDKIKKETENVREMGIEAAVSNQVIAEFIRNNLDLSKASELARVAQDAATISGKNSTEALNGIITGIVTLQPEVIRTNGIVINLIKAENELADSLGINTNELTATQKQQAALNAVLEAGTSVAGAYEAAMTSGSKIIRSYPRYINDILVNMGAPFLDAFGRGAKALGEFLKNIGKMTAEGGELRPMLDKLAASAGLFADKFVVFIENFDVEGFAKGLTTVLDLIIKFATFLISHKTLVVGALSSITGALGILVTASTILNVFKLIEGVQGLFMAFTGVSEAISAVGIATGSIALPSLAALAAALLPILAILAGLISTVAFWAVLWKINIFDIQGTWKTFVSVMKSLWKALTAFLRGDTEEAVGYLHEAWTTLVDLIQERWKKWFGTFPDDLRNFFNFVRGAFNLLLTQVRDAFARVDWAQIGRNIFLGMANGMLLGIPSLILVAAQAAKSVLDTIKKSLDIGSPSKKAMKLGMFTAQGFQMGLQRVSPEDMARSLVRPITNQSSSRSQTINNYFPTGLTVSQVSSVVDERLDKFTETIIASLGSA